MSTKIASKIHSFLKAWLSEIFMPENSSIWSTVQQNMPRNIFNFSIKFLNNTLPTRKNLCKWSISQSSACSFCLQSETLQHVISSCKCYLEEGRYTWRLLYLANTFSSLSQCKIYADLPSFNSPCLIIGDSLRPDLLLLTGNNVLYILEFTLGFETNMHVNSIRKANKYNKLLKDLSSIYNKVLVLIFPWVLLVLWALRAIPFYCCFSI